MTFSMRFPSAPQVVGHPLGQRWRRAARRQHPAVDPGRSGTQPEKLGRAATARPPGWDETGVLCGGFPKMGIPLLVGSSHESEMGSVSSHPSYLGGLNLAPTKIPFKYTPTMDWFQGKSTMGFFF